MKYESKTYLPPLIACWLQDPLSTYEVGVCSFEDGAAVWSHAGHAGSAYLHDGIVAINAYTAASGLFLCIHSYIL